MPPNLIQDFPMATQAAMLAQHAEECAQTAASAATMYKSMQDGRPAQLETLGQTASQASKRIAWAQDWLDSYFPAKNDTGECGRWFAQVRQLVRQSAGVAATSAKACGVGT